MVADICLLTLALLAQSCAGRATFEQNVYRRGATAYRVGGLSSLWLRVYGKGPDLVFRHRHGGTIVANSQCRSGEDVPLEVLQNHLLFGMDRQAEAPPQTLTLDGRAALRSRVRAALDGVAVELDLVVLKKDGCIYDLQLIAGATEFTSRQDDFAAFWQGFATQPAR